MSIAQRSEEANRDINELFDQIVLTEEHCAQQGYNEGLEVGREQGKQEGYQLGYSQGVQLGEELGNIYGFVAAQQQLPHAVKVQRNLQQLKQLIDIFPRTNNTEVNIIGALEDIRTLNKRVHAMLRAQNTNRSVVSTAAKKDYTF